MSVSHLQLSKSETRQLAEHDRGTSNWRLGEPTEWKMGNSTFFTAFVVIAAGLTLLALVLR